MKSPLRGDNPGLHVSFLKVYSYYFLRLIQYLTIHRIASFLLPDFFLPVITGFLLNF